MGAPLNPEYGIGAITEESYYWADENALKLVDATSEQLEETLNIEQIRIEDRIQKYRAGRRLPLLTDKTVILVDDGLATGVTIRAAHRYLTSLRAKKIVIATPVCSQRTAEELGADYGPIVCILEPEQFSAVSQFYNDFTQISDTEVSELLNQAHTFWNDLRTRSLHRSDLLLRDVIISDEDISGPSLKGSLVIPHHATGLVIFAHGSGSTHLSPRNQKIAADLNRAGLATLLFDLLTEEESLNHLNVFDIPLLAKRLMRATQWVKQQRETCRMNIGYFGASTGAAAALWAAAEPGNDIHAIVSRGGRPDLAIAMLPRVLSPTLLIVGAEDHPVIELNQSAIKHIKNGKLVLIPGATHLFEEPETLEEVSHQALLWFNLHLNRKEQRRGVA